MNPLGNGNIQNNFGAIPPELKQSIQQVKGMMGMLRGNPQSMMQQNPMINQAIQMCNGQNPEMVFKSMCKQRGIDPDAFINELRN